MTTQEFEKTYWKYYLLLENDFLSTEKFVALDKDNAKAFSMEYMKIFQMICAEIDVCAKVFASIYKMILAMIRCHIMEKSYLRNILI